MGKKHQERPKQAPKRGNKVWIFWVLATGVLALAGLMMIGYYSQTAPTVADATPVRVDMSGFAPAEIQAKAGQPVKLELINMDDAGHTDGGGWHNLIVDALGVSEKVAPKGKRVITFTPTQPGEYDFYCDICCGGKENPYMHGRLIVS